jgi:hypothetical protein
MSTPTGLNMQNAATDPFQTSPIVIDNQVYQYLQYYLSVAHEQLLCSTGLVQSKTLDPFLSCAASMIQACFKNELLMYSLLANISTMLPEMEFSSSSPYSTYYCYQAIKSLRHHLSTPTRLDESIIVGLWHLISAENNRGDFRAALVHLNGASAIFKYLEESAGLASPRSGALLRASAALLAAGTTSDKLPFSQGQEADILGGEM